METAKLLYMRSSEIPEGLYIELMDKLKIDFENFKEKENYTHPLQRILDMIFLILILLFITFRLVNYLN